jgi:RNA polymerase sigma-70 factor (ECF subfamily)
MLAIPTTLLPFPLAVVAGLVPPGARTEARPSARKPAWASTRTIPADHGAAVTANRVELGVDQRSDETLLADYRRGDRAAFRLLLGRYKNELLHFLIRFLGSRAAADDVFQETFLQVHLSAGTFDVERRFKPWLFTIAANKARDHHRKHSRRAPVSLSVSMSGEDEGARFIDLLEADLPEPAEPVADAEQARLVKQVLDQLPDHLREIILLSYFQRFSYQQIAEVLSIPLGTVKSRLHAAVAAFARDWKDAFAHLNDEPNGEDLD